MTCFLKRFLPFVLTLTIGVLFGGLFHQGHKPKTDAARFVYSGPGEGYYHWHRHQHGYAYDYNAPAIITSRAPAQYTAAARRNGIKGIVRLRVTLGSNGSVYDITPVISLPYGLTEEAIKAAQQIEFRPAYEHGYPVDSTQYLEYLFDGRSTLSDGIYVDIDG